MFNEVYEPLQIIVHDPILIEEFEPPDLTRFVHLKWWTVLEACMVLTGWSEHNLFSTTLIQRVDIPKTILDERSETLLPGHAFFNLGDYSETFQEMFHAISTDVASGVLRARKCNIIDGINALLDPFEVIFLAIQKNHSLPSALENAIKVRPITCAKLNSWLKKVEIMIAVQYSSLANPKYGLNDYVKCESLRNQIFNIFKQYQSNAPQNLSGFRYSAENLRGDVLAILKKGVSGRPRKEDANPKNTCKVLIKIIPNVLKKRRGVVDCNFSLLETVVRRIVALKLNKEGLENFLATSFLNFVDSMKADTILALYLRDSPQVIVRFVERAIEESYSLYTSLSSSESIRRHMPKQWIVKLN